MMAALALRLPRSFGITRSITHIRLDAGLSGALHVECELARRAVQLFRLDGIEPVDGVVDEDTQLAWTVALAGAGAALDDDPQVAEGVFG